MRPKHIITRDHRTLLEQKGWQVTTEVENNASPTGKHFQTGRCVVMKDDISLLVSNEVVQETLIKPFSKDSTIKSLLERFINGDPMTVKEMKIIGHSCH